MKFLTENDRKKGVELYMMMIKSKHDKLYNHNQKLLRKQRRSSSGPSTYMVGGRYVPKSDVRSVTGALESGKDFDFIEIPWTSKNTPFSAMRRVDGEIELMNLDGDWEYMESAKDAAVNLDIHGRVDFGKFDTDDSGEKELD
jgi:hypothetical protein